MKRTMRMPLVTLLLSMTACGYTHEGDGTNTLEVTAQSFFVSGSTSSAVPTGITTVTVEVKKAGAGLSHAVVTVQDGETDDITTAVPVGALADGKYALTLPGYHRRLGLHVTSGADEVWAELEGPGKHTIEEPKHASTVKLSSLGKKLHIRWKTEDGIQAQRIDISVNDAESFNVDDDRGRHDVPVTALHGGANTLSVKRSNSVILKGGAGVSSFTSNYEVRSSITVE